MTSSEVITTITFNTSRPYTQEGQVITVRLFADGTVWFNDHSRMIWGKTLESFNPGLVRSLNGLRLALQSFVMDAYDNMQYASSLEAGSLRRVKRYNHVCTIAFSVISDTEDGSDITPAMLREELLRRVSDLPEDEWLEACLPIWDTFEFDPSTEGPRGDKPVVSLGELVRRLSKGTDERG